MCYKIKSYDIIFLCYFIRKEYSAKQTAESYNEHVANPLNQSSLQYDTAKDRYANTSTTSSKPSVIDDGVNTYEFKRQMMGYAIFIINWKFDDGSTHPVAKIDGSNMSRLFEALGFKIETLENKTTAELKEKLVGMYISTRPIPDDSDDISLVPKHQRSSKWVCKKHVVHQ